MRRVVVLISLLLIAIAGSVQAEHATEPSSVRLVGDLGGDLTFDPTHQLWLATIDVAAGEYAYAIEADGEAFDGPALMLNTDSEVTIFVSTGVVKCSA